MIFGADHHIQPLIVRMAFIRLAFKSSKRQTCLQNKAQRKFKSRQAVWGEMTHGLRVCLCSLYSEEAKQTPAWNAKGTPLHGGENGTPDSPSAGEVGAAAEVEGTQGDQAAEGR